VNRSEKISLHGAAGGVPIKIRSVHELLTTAIFPPGRSRAGSYPESSRAGIRLTDGWLRTGQTAGACPNASDVWPVKYGTACPPRVCSELRSAAASTKPASVSQKAMDSADAAGFNRSAPAVSAAAPREQEIIFARNSCHVTAYGLWTGNTIGHRWRCRLQPPPLSLSDRFDVTHVRLSFY
jgi:hypothetical protein